MVELFSGNKYSEFVNPEEKNSIIANESNKPSSLKDYVPLEELNREDNEAEWINGDSLIRSDLKCSKCGYPPAPWFIRQTYWYGNYCTNCGRKMKNPHYEFVN